MIPPYEQELILAHILKKSREYVLTHPDIALTKHQQKQYRNMAARRLKNEPLAYILGHKEFYGLDFKVSPQTLIPRPETELLIEEVLRLKPKNSFIIDVGTGSGNIIISLSKNIKEKNTYFGVDISEKALAVAKYNARKHKVYRKIRFIKSDLMDHFIKYRPLNIKQLIIVANLPYLSEKIYNSTMPDVKNHEPKIALYGGSDGLEYYKRLFKQIQIIKENCYMLHVSCYMEISPEQKKKLSKIAKKDFPGCKIGFKKDLGGKWRIAILRPKQGLLSS